MVTSPPLAPARPGHPSRPFRAVWRRLALVAAFGSAPLGLTAAQQQVTQADPNPHGKLNTPCATCHTADGWKPARIDRTFDHAKTGFLLVESHAAVACTTCHTSLEFSTAPNSCASCHQDVHQGEFGTTCDQCHNARAFNDRTAMAQSHALTLFPLDGAHRDVDCRSCHASSGGGAMAFKGAPIQCVGCHQADYARTTTPPHKASGFPTDCTTCHTNLMWQGSSFDHNTTQFPLTGGHQAAACQDCHKNGVYKGLATTCVSCHQTDFDKTTNPNHPSASFPTDCTTCHTTVTWQGATFDHNTTQFPLTGGHQAAACQDCHKNGVYKGLATTCVSCHQTDYNNTTTPNHQSAGFPTDCVTCHTTVTWQGAAFDHNSTQFPLTGAHQATACQDCHKNGVYKGLATTCVSCHQTDYNNTTNPNHQSAGFPTDCTTCHTTVTWQGAQFDHNTTQFPLTGAHQATACQDCHKNGVYKGLATTCVSCHQTDYNNTTNPNHQSAGFPTDCTTCHTTVTWQGASFDHSTTAFPLTGVHTTTPCQDCHTNGVYKGLPSTCVSCHQTDYNNTSNPNHTAAGFPTDCVSCHTTSTWLGAQFNHDGQYFPIYSGKHRGQWNACSDCHQNSSSYAVFTCLTCHEHSKSQMDSAHQGRSGYVYDSQACYSCHPRGQS
jgi:hypothetical protein